MLSIFQGSFLVFALMAVGLIFFAYKAYKARESGWQSDSVAGGHKEGKEKLPWTSIGWFWFAVIMACAIIGYFIIQNAEK